MQWQLVGLDQRSYPTSVTAVDVSVEAKVDLRRTRLQMGP